MPKIKIYLESKHGGGDILELSEELEKDVLKYLKKYAPDIMDENYCTQCSTKFMEMLCGECDRELIYKRKK